MTYYAIVKFERDAIMHYREIEATSFADATSQAERKARDIPRQLKALYGRIKEISVERVIP